MNDKYYWQWREEKKKRQEAEGELTIIKGIGSSSPEMKALQKEVEELKADLARAKEDHQSGIYGHGTLISEGVRGEGGRKDIKK